jgi:predicted aconitase with swiveling domain
MVSDYRTKAWTEHPVGLGDDRVEFISHGRTLVAGDAKGELLSALVGLSFWGGVDPQTGVVIDQHHPLRNQSLAGRVLAIPSGRGSCSGSGVLLELILNGHAPAAIVICEREEILTLGALIAEVVFEQSIPVLRVEREVFTRLGEYRYARVATQPSALPRTARRGLAARTGTAWEQRGHDNPAGRSRPSVRLWPAR